MNGDRIIGEDKTLSIKVGAEAGNATTEDIIVVRGIRADVDRAVKEIKKIVEDAQNDEIVSSYVRSAVNVLNVFALTLPDNFRSPRNSKSARNTSDGSSAHRALA